jgi:hypothetical protein
MVDRKEHSFVNTFTSVVFEASGVDIESEMYQSGRHLGPAVSSAVLGANITGVQGNN